MPHWRLRQVVASFPDLAPSSGYKRGLSGSQNIPIIEEGFAEELRRTRAGQRQRHDDRAVVIFEGKDVGLGALRQHLGSDPVPLVALEDGSSGLQVLPERTQSFDLGGGSGEASAHGLPG